MVVLLSFINFNSKNLNYLRLSRLLRSLIFDQPHVQNLNQNVSHFLRCYSIYSLPDPFIKLKYSLRCYRIYSLPDPYIRVQDVFERMITAPGVM